MKFRASEGFSRAERGAIDELLSSFGQKGVFTGALTDERGELRPVILVDSRLLVFRTVASTDSETRSKFLEVLQKLKRIADPSVIECGAFNSDVWFCRAYAPQTLDSVERLSEEQSIALVRAVASELFKLHEVGISHGNVSANNVALTLNQSDNSFASIQLVDGGMYVSGRIAPSSAIIAPESREVSGSTKEIDIYALGILAERFLYKVATPSIRRLIEGMTAIDPKDRPFVGEVLSVLNGSMQLDLSRGVKPAQVRGKILSGVTIKRDEGQASPKVVADVAPSIQGDKPQQSTSQDLQSKAARGINVSSQTIMKALFGGIFIGIIGALYIKFSTPSIPALEYWISGQSELMSEVARAAIKNPESESGQVVISDVVAGNQRRQIRTNFLRTVFNPLWAAELSTADKRAALSLGLLSLTPLTEDPPRLEELHPALLFGVLADLGIRTDLGKSAELPLSLLAHLPAPVGESLKILARTGVKTVGDTATRAFAHIYTQDTSVEVLRGYFSDSDVQLRLAAILPILISEPGLAPAIFEFLPETSDQIANMLLWFGVSDAPHWSAAEPLQIISILAGVVPDEGLTFEQLSDLSRFPDASVAKQVVPLLLQQGLSVEDQDLLIALTDEGSKLDRLQAMSLLAGLQVKGEARFGYFSNWFKMKPDTTSVVSLLVSRSKFTTLDPFSLEASRYLKDRNWNAPLEQLEKLSLHNDPLARALAYVKLKPEIQEHRRVLEHALSTEKNERLKEEIQDRLREEAIVSQGE